jgi:hypothetical protein
MSISLEVSQIVKETMTQYFFLLLLVFTDYLPLTSEFQHFADFELFVVFD